MDGLCRALGSRPSFPGWLVAGVLAALAAAGCGGVGTTATTTPPPSSTVGTGTFAPAPPSTTSAPTTPPPTTAGATTTTTSTVTTLPPEPWQVPGRRYYFPIQPPGDATYGAAHHDYPAADIFAPAGAPVVAVTAGVIEELRRDDPWQPGVDDPATRGGRFVSLLGDDGVRYYFSHLQAVAEGIEAGGRVAAGRVIGTVGTSGNAATTPPHCHFGISRPTFAGDWEARRGEVWPYEWLQAWEQGRDATPVLPAG